MQECTDVHSDVQECTGVYRGAQERAGMYWGVQKCAGVCKSAQGWTGGAQVCTGVYRGVLECTGVCGSAQERTGVLKSVQGFTGAPEPPRRNLHAETSTTWNFPAGINSRGHIFLQVNFAHGCSRLSRVALGDGPLVLLL